VKMMSKRRTSGSTGDDEQDYEVGYGKPPTHSQFRPGQSGNPAGRRRGVRNLKTDVMRMLRTPVKVTEGGRTRTRSTQEGALMVLREQALRANARSLDRLFELAERFNSDAGELGPAEALSADDQAILSAYVAESVAAAMTPPPGKSPDEAAPKRGARSNKKARK
jgi:hypothetical protein